MHLSYIVFLSNRSSSWCLLLEILLSIEISATELLEPVIWDWKLTSPVSTYITWEKGLYYGWRSIRWYCKSKLLQLTQTIACRSISYQPYIVRISCEILIASGRSYAKDDPEIFVGLCSVAHSRQGKCLIHLNTMHNSKFFEIVTKNVEINVFIYTILERSHVVMGHDYAFASLHPCSNYNIGFLLENDVLSWKSGNWRVVY